MIYSLKVTELTTEQKEALYAALLYSNKVAAGRYVLPQSLVTDSKLVISTKVLNAVMVFPCEGTAYFTENRLKDLRELPVVYPVYSGAYWVDLRGEGAAKKAYDTLVNSGIKVCKIVPNEALGLTRKFRFLPSEDTLNISDNFIVYSNNGESNSSFEDIMGLLEGGL